MLSSNSIWTCLEKKKMLVTSMLVSFLYNDFFPLKERLHHLVPFLNFLLANAFSVDMAKILSSGKGLKGLKGREMTG